MNKDPHKYMHTDTEMMKSFNASMDKFYDQMLQKFLGVILFALFCYTVISCCCKKVSRTISDRNQRAKNLEYKYNQNEIEDHYKRATPRQIMPESFKK